MNTRVKVLLFFLLSMGISVNSTAAPNFVRVSFSDPQTSTIMGVSWNTDNETDSVVQYGINDAYGQEATGSKERGRGPLNWIHSVQLTELEPDTIYHYRVGSPGDWSPDYTFKTGTEDGCTPFVFIALGDERSQGDEGASENWPPILEQASEDSPAFILNSGDMVRDGGDENQWHNWLGASDAYHPYFPDMPVIGNHDDGPGEGDGANYNQIFFLPRNEVSNTEDYYYFIYGDAIFVGLSTQTFKGGSPQFSEQADWLDQVLTDNPKTWKFVFFHHPVYSSEDLMGWILHPPNEADQNAALVPVFDRHHVDLIVAGHNHWYERFAPSYGGGGDDQPHPVSDPSQGTIYVTSGGAGAFTFDLIDDIDFLENLGITVESLCAWQEGSEKCAGEHHYIKVTIDGSTLTYEVWATAAQNFSNSGDNIELIDSLTITKEPVSPNPCTSVEVEESIEVVESIDSSPESDEDIVEQVESEEADVEEADSESIDSESVDSEEDAEEEIFESEPEEDVFEDTEEESPEEEADSEADIVPDTAVTQRDTGVRESDSGERVNGDSAVVVPPKSDCSCTLQRGSEFRGRLWWGIIGVVLMLIIFIYRPRRSKKSLGNI